MADVTINRLGDEAQRDNESRYDYLHPTQVDAQVRGKLSASDVRAYGAVAGLFWLGLTAVAWLVRGGVCYADSYAAECSVARGFSWLATFAPLLFGGAFAAVEVWRRKTITSAEAKRASITRDRYLNPISADAVLAMAPETLWQTFVISTQAEVAMAPYKQLPVGLDSLSVAGGSAPAKAAETAPALPDDGGVGIVPVAEWMKWVDEQPHVMLAAKTKGGKSTTAKAIMAARVADGGALFIVDPHSSEWFDLPSVGGGENWQEVAHALDAVQGEYRARLQERDRHMRETGKELPVEHFPRLTVLLDEANNTRDALDRARRGEASAWQQFAKVLGSGARKVNMSMILLCQSAVVEDIGLSGSMRQNFTRIALDDRTIKLMIAQEETDPARRKLLYAALPGQTFPAATVIGARVELLDRAGLDRYPHPTSARGQLWQGWSGAICAANEPTPDPATVGASAARQNRTERRDQIIRLAFGKGQSVRRVATIVRGLGYEVDNDRLVELRREVLGADSGAH